MLKQFECGTLVRGRKRFHAWDMQIFTQSRGGGGGGAQGFQTHDVHIL